MVEALADSANPTDYIKKMKKRDPELAKGWGQIVTPLSVQTAGGKQRVNCATQQRESGDGSLIRKEDQRTPDLPDSEP